MKQPCVIPAKIGAAALHASGLPSEHPRMSGGGSQCSLRTFLPPCPCVFFLGAGTMVKAKENLAV